MYDSAETEDRACRVLNVLITLTPGSQKFIDGIMRTSCSNSVQPFLIYELFFIIIKYCENEQQ